MTANELMTTSAETERRISDGIEQNRKGDFSVKTDFAPGTVVHFRQKNHAFRFGANLFMLGEIGDKPEKNAIYEEKFRSLFNMATLPFYWSATEPEEGHTRYAVDAPPLYRRPPIDRCLKFCEENGIEPREHALCYEHQFPAWLTGRSPDEIYAALERRIAEIAARYADRIPTMEITNEMFWREWMTPIYKDPDYVAECFRLAEKYLPHNELCINEWVTAWNTGRDAYQGYIRSAIGTGARIDAIGLQYHMFFKRDEYVERARPFYDKAALIDALDSYAAFGKPIEITEVTIPAFSDDAEDEQAQADILEQLYSLWFSHPSVSQIIYWNLVDGYAYNAEPGDMSCGENYYYGGLLHFDMSEKPAFRRLKYLLCEKWHTEGDATVGDDGTISFRGFFGDYELCSDGKVESVSLTSARK
ncbi:MAG: endo-1,4-beta-xylanase [Clostridia bacterium]|nr:endo-1,4-beta-xylanase [Clostridia bacterium]